MGRGINKLTALSVKKLQAPGYYIDGAGLYLQISAFGTKSWIFKYTLNGRSREMGLGSEHTISLVEARDSATQQRKLLLQGIDPIEARDNARRVQLLAAAKRITFDECAGKYIAIHKASWKNPKHHDQWTNTLATYANPFIGSLCVADIDTGLVLQCLNPIWTTKTETATRLRGRIEKVLDWAKTQDLREGENPARWKGHLEHSLAAPNKIAKTKHHPALPYSQIGAFIKELRDREGMAAKALEFCILTAVRSSEIRGAVWGEFDLDAAVWTIPAERMKMNNEHRVPLSGRALSLIVARMSDATQEAGGKKPAASDLVFPNASSERISDMSLSAVIKRMNEGGDSPRWVDPKRGNRRAVPHGFRSTFSDWAAECTNHDRKICEKALAHLVGDETERAYQRGDLLEKRRNVMDDWAKYCNSPQGGANVVPIKSKAAA